MAIQCVIFLAFNYQGHTRLKSCILEKMVVVYHISDILISLLTFLHNFSQTLFFQRKRVFDCMYHMILQSYSLLFTQKS